MVYHYTIVFDSTPLQTFQVRHLTGSQYSNQKLLTKPAFQNSPVGYTSNHLELKHSPDRHQDPWCKQAILSQNIFLEFDQESLTSKEPGDLQESLENQLSDNLHETSGSQNVHIESNLEKHSSVDWRFGQIEISGLDMDSLNKKPSKDIPAQAASSEAAVIPRNDLPVRPPRSKSFGLGSRPDLLKARFMGYGVVRLYHDDSEFRHSTTPEARSSWDQTVSKNKILPISETSDPNQIPVSDTAPESHTTLSILAVPSYLTFYDLIGFLGPNGRDNVSHIRMVRTAQPNRYMVLLRFRTPESAKEFYDEYNGKLFNSMEAETCQVIYVNKIEFRNSTRAKHKKVREIQPEKHKVRDGLTLAERLRTQNAQSLALSPAQASSSSKPSQIPYLLDDPFTLDAISDEDEELGASGLQGNPAVKPAPPPTPMLSELPTCPVCLERMDATVTGLLTIPCLHTFHCQCLSKWKDGSCPVCRYSQREAEKQPGQCAVCDSRDNLWICLICGNIGCGRYDNAHAFDHYQVTGHCYAMDMSTQRVWDYASDSYVHRLLQNQIDGKLVELPNTQSRNDQGSSFVQGERGLDSLAAYDVADAAIKAADKSEKKLSDMSIHLTQMLSSQLESQRDYYESLITAASDRMTQAITRASAAEHENEKMRTELKVLNSLVPDLYKQLSKATKNLEKTASKLDQLESSLNEEKLINEQTILKLKRLEENEAKKDMEVTELNETIRDLMFFHEAQAKLQNVDEDIKEGTIVVPLTNTDSKKAKPKVKGKGKRR